jgi:two-component system sensor histidine kinase RpfC
VSAQNIEEGVARLVAEISFAKPYHSALIYGTGDTLKLAQRFKRLAPEPAPPAVLAVLNVSDGPRFQALYSGFAAVLELPFDKRRLFNVLHSVAAGTESAEGVVSLQEYAKRVDGGRRFRVLVADDNPTNREVIGKILERGGHTVTLVNDGEQALDEIESKRYDLVILDRNMPGTGGIEALQALRVMTRARERLPVIILSADAALETKRAALDAGADAFLPKPIEALRLLEEVHRLAKPESRQPVESLAAEGGEAVEQATVLNEDTIKLLEELGSSPEFVRKLAGVFISDNSAILKRIEEALGARNFREVRSHLHALKGSAASMGTDRLTAVCSSFSKLSDSEMRLQTPGMLGLLTKELGDAQRELQRYVSHRIAESAG